MKRKKLWTIAAITASAALLLYIIYGIWTADQNLPALSPGNKPMYILGGEVTNHRFSAKSWTFDYDKAQLSPDGSFAQLDGLHNGTYYKNGHPLVRVSAQHATLNTASFDFTATGHVKIQRINTNQTFETDLIRWTNRTKLLEFPHASLVTTKGHKLKVENVTYNAKTGALTIGTIDGEISP